MRSNGKVGEDKEKSIAQSVQRCLVAYDLYWKARIPSKYFTLVKSSAQITLNGPVSRNLHKDACTASSDRGKLPISILTIGEQ